MIFLINQVIKAFFEIDAFLFSIDFIFIGNDFTFQLTRDLICHTVFLQCALRRRAADNQRRARLINQDVIHLIDDGIIQLTLHALFQVNHHVIPKIIKTKLIVCAVGDICLIGFLTGNRLEMFPQVAFFAGIITGVKQERNPTLTAGGLLPLNAGYAHPQSMINRTHPVRMRFGKIIVNRHQMHPSA